jgi:hypothetical protein
LTVIKPFQFVVTATGPNGLFWLSRARASGLRTLVVRDQADEFSTVADAQVAIKQMPRAFRLAGVSFAIELSSDSRAARQPSDTD